MNHADLIDRLGGCAAVARRLSEMMPNPQGKPVITEWGVSKWKGRSSIPPLYWDSILTIAADRHPPIFITLDDLKANYPQLQRRMAEAAD